jgi:restriction system protein
MRPVLALTEDGNEWPATSIRESIIRQFELSAEEVAERIPSGRDTILRNRVGWALTYLYQAGLLSRPRRSVYKLTERGRTVLRDHPERVDISVLNAFEEFQAFKPSRGAAPRRPRPDEGAQTEIRVADEATPEERAASAYLELRDTLASDVLERVAEQSPEFFEDVVLDVLYAMGYGGSRDDAAERLGRTGDEGVDGVIREDKLGLDLIYVQAKKWSNPVGRPAIQGFVGALQGQRASKGVFITTSSFSRDAVTYADTVTPRVILVDGPALAQLMIDHGVGVSVTRTFEIKRIDQDYFEAGEDIA